MIKLNSILNEIRLVSSNILILQHLYSSSYFLYNHDLGEKICFYISGKNKSIISANYPPETIKIIQKYLDKKHIPYKTTAPTKYSEIMHVLIPFKYSIIKK